MQCHGTGQPRRDTSMPDPNPSPPLHIWVQMVPVNDRGNDAQERGLVSSGA